MFLLSFVLIAVYDWVESYSGRRSWWWDYICYCSWYVHLMCLLLELFSVHYVCFEECKWSLAVMFLLWFWTLRVIRMCTESNIFFLLFLVFTVADFCFQQLVKCYMLPRHLLRRVTIPQSSAVVYFRITSYHSSVFYFVYCFDWRMFSSLQLITRLLRMLSPFLTRLPCQSMSMTVSPLVLSFLIIFSQGWTDFSSFP